MYVFKVKLAVLNPEGPKQARLVLAGSLAEALTKVAGMLTANPTGASFTQGQAVVSYVGNLDAADSIEASAKLL